MLWPFLKTINGFASFYTFYDIPMPHSLQVSTWWRPCPSSQIFCHSFPWSVFKAHWHSYWFWKTENLIPVLGPFFLLSSLPEMFWLQIFPGGSLDSIQIAAQMLLFRQAFPDKPIYINLITHPLHFSLTHHLVFYSLYLTLYY